ncbi:septal ring lytic transglycosylase RlpA family protein [uncultured Cohaesibacter sp.]|uniref:septal ring lytic transglycosylase RlpA family protein n=1 Tax=uncultured Cohaesibacter sp. TaxID=1002546 RepID=UPI0029C60D57|nr:septal ring lytic transglycosylase RlpA family protein [uncultured Cohaesibacter sp.]
MLDKNKSILLSAKQPTGYDVVVSIAKNTRVGMLIALLSVTGLVLSGCSSSSKKSRVDPKYGVSASARVATKSGEFVKGGGVYKVGKPYKVAGRTYVPKEQPSYNKVGKASWYGDDFHGRLTANGEIFDMNSLTGAHPTLPLPSYVRVTNLNNGKSTLVRVNDRGPYAHGRIIDLSHRVAQKLGFINDGITNVRVQYVGRARMDGHDTAFLENSYRDRGQPIGNDKLNLPAGGGSFESSPVMIASASVPRSKPQPEANDLMLGQLPQLTAPDATAFAPSTVDLASSAPSAGWAPVDLVGDGYFPPEGMGTLGTPIELASMAPIQLNYAPSSSMRVDAGYAAIDRILGQNKQPGLAEALARKARDFNETDSIEAAVGPAPKAMDQIGRFDPTYGMRLAQEFAMLAAVDIRNEDDGTISLVISKLKPGVTWSDIADMRSQLGLS